MTALATGATLHATDLEPRLQAVERLGIVGGKIYSATTGNVVSGAAAGTEAYAYDSGTLSLKANRKYDIRAVVHWNTSIGTPNVELRIREDTASGTERGYRIVSGPSAGTPYQHEIFASYEPSVDVSKLFVVTVKLNGASGTLNVQRSGSGVLASAARVEVFDAGPSGKVTSV